MAVASEVVNEHSEDGGEAIICWSMTEDQYVKSSWCRGSGCDCDYGLFIGLPS